MTSKIVDTHCPGDDPSKKHIPQILVCPKCGGDAEIWSDEDVGRCLACKEKIHRDELTTP